MTSPLFVFPSSPLGSSTPTGVTQAANIQDLEEAAHSIVKAASLNEYQKPDFAKGMQTLRKLYRIGLGPSSSHTMGPRRAAEQFLQRFPDADHFRCTLYGSLALTGKGHFTDKAIITAFAPRRVEIIWDAETTTGLKLHNPMDFVALSAEGAELGRARWYSVGGGSIVPHETVRQTGPPGTAASERHDIYPISTLRDLLDWCFTNGRPMWQYAIHIEGEAIMSFFAQVWDAMKTAINRGLATQGALPGGLNYPRKARSHWRQGRRMTRVSRKTALLQAYALAVAEENAGMGIVVTAPTCGACGVVPAVMHYLQDELQVCDEEIHQALAIAGLVGNMIKANASISGAECGCQAEIGTACSMAAAAAAHLMGATPHQIEYAAEMGMEHFLGLTCDPVHGLVQIPCIERNAFAATRAVDSAEFSLLTDGTHRVSFDDVVMTMRRTGRDIQAAYRETSTGGLAKTYRLHKRGLLPKSHFSPMEC